MDNKIKKKKTITKIDDKTELIPPELRETLQSLTPQKREEFIKTISLSLIKWKAPIPRPQDLEHYEKIKKGLADRIVTMSEKEQSYRHALNNTGLAGEIRLRTLALFFSFIIVIICLLTTVILYYLSKDSKLAIALIVEIALIASGFIYWSKKDKSKEDKSINTHN